MGSNEDKTNYYNEYIEADRKARRFDQEAEKQQLYVQKVQQQNTTLTSQLELYKERVRVLENIKGDNNYLNEFLEANRKTKHFNQQAQSQFIHDQDIIRDLKQQCDKLDLAVIDYKRQKEEYQKTQTIFNQTQHDKEEKYLNDITQLQAKHKDLENVVCKMGKSTEILRLLTNEKKAFRDNLRKSGLGYNGPYVLLQAYAKIPKLYRAYELCNKNEQQHVFDSEETLVLKKLNKLYDDFVSQKELSAEQTYFSTSFISSEKVSSETKPSMASMPSANSMLMDLNKMEKHKSLENNSLKTLQKENENFMASLQIENAHLKQTYKDLFDSAQRTQLENLKGKRVETKLDNSLILGKPSLLNNERDQLLKQIASLESKLASQDIRSCQKEYHELRTSYNALKVKFDSLNRKKWNINVSKSSKLKESVLKKVHTGVKDTSASSRSKPRSNTKKDGTLPAKSDMKKVEAHSRNNKSSVKQKNRVVSSISFKRIVLNSNSTSVCQTCHKCLMSFNHDKCVVRSLKFVKKSLVNKVWRVKQVKQVWNDHFGAIMGYEDYVIGDSVISRVYYVEGLGYNLFSVRQFYDLDLEVAFHKHSCHVRDVNGVDLIKGNRGSNLYTVSVEDMMKSSPICLLSKASKNKSWLWHRWTMLIFSKALMFLWAEVVATACDEVFIIWKAFVGNTRDLGSFGEETDKTTDLHQNLLMIMLTKRGDGVASIKRCRYDLRSNDISTLGMPSEHG
ncbi:hypothetical protein Tco_0616524 [Tanacetum coccineum]